LRRKTPVQEIDLTNSETYSSFVLLRHALSEANRDGIIQGQSDYPLAEEGLQQIDMLIDSWESQERSFDRIICSPLTRAKDTALRIAEYLDIDLELDDIWKERHHGDAQDIAYSQARQWYSDGHPASPFEPVFASGESDWDLHIRASKAVRNLVILEPGSYLIVSHGGFLGAVLRAILGIAPSFGRTRPVRFSFKNTGFAELRYRHDEARWYFDALNSTTHLKID
jgi:broad specificity phosphatase PhoE